MIKRYTNLRILYFSSGGPETEVQGQIPDSGLSDEVPQ